MKKLILAIFMIAVLCSFVYSASTASLMSWYDCENNVNDARGLYDGTATNMNYAAGKVGSYSCGELDTGHYFTIPNDAFDTLQSNLTGCINVWVKFTQLTENLETVFDVSDNSGLTLQSYATGQKLHYKDYVPAEDSAVSTAPLETDKWYMLTVSWDESGLAGYINNELNVTDGSFDVDFIENQVMNWGVQYSSSSYIRGLSGNVDSISIWNSSCDSTRVDLLWNDGDGCDYDCFAIAGGGVDFITVANNTYGTHSINFTSEGGQACGYNTAGGYTLCGPTEEETPTITFRTVANNGASCKLWNESLNWTTLDNNNVSSDCTLQDNVYTCTWPAEEKLADGNHTLYISCKSGDNEINDFNAYPANSFTILVSKQMNSSTAIEDGIKSSSIWPGAAIYSNQPVYVRTTADQQAFGTFDKVAVYKNQRWAFNYVSVDENPISPFYNLSPVFYFMEFQNITTTSITNQVRTFIDSTIS